MDGLQRAVINKMFWWILKKSFQRLCRPSASLTLSEFVIKFGLHHFFLCHERKERERKNRNQKIEFKKEVFSFFSNFKKCSFSLEKKKFDDDFWKRKTDYWFEDYLRVHKAKFVLKSFELMFFFETVWVLVSSISCCFDETGLCE